MRARAAPTIFSTLGVERSVRDRAASDLAAGRELGCSASQCCGALCGETNYFDNATGRWQSSSPRSGVGNVPAHRLLMELFMRRRSLRAARLGVVAVGLAVAHVPSVLK